MEKDIEGLGSCLLDIQQPISKRTQAAFHLRTINTDEAVEIIKNALSNRLDGALMRHEFAYILGQMQNKNACQLLAEILSDETDDLLVRHESAEALGAIGDLAYEELLTQYSSHQFIEIAETCQIAVDLLAWKRNNANQPHEHHKLYICEDPAPPLKGKTSVVEVGADLINKRLSLFDRYRAMFTLRDMNNDEAALALVQGLSDESALFRHEVAFVLGQMQREVTIDGLTRVLENYSEHRMVRHEAAEALGAIGGEKVKEILLRNFQDQEIIVHQSCDVALDAMDYWSKEFSNNNNGLS
jgi:deoxyhypusine monooxygenase